jgi:hypothetical protein
MKRKKPDLFEEQLQDLGFGSRVAEPHHLRLLNRDGSFNIT